MRKSFLYILVGCLSASIAGSGAYALSAKEGEKYASALAANQDSSSAADDFWGSQNESDDTPDSAFSKVIKNIMNDNDFAIQSGRTGTVGFEADSLMSEELVLGLKDTEFNFLDSSAPKVKGTVCLGYTGLSEEAGLAYDSDGQVYISYRGGQFKVGLNADYSGLFDVVNALSSVVSTPAVPETSGVGNIDLNSLLSTLETAVGNIGDGTLVGGVRTFTLAVDEITVSAVTISNINLTLTADENYSLTGVYTSSPIVINDKFKLSLNLPLTMSKDTVTYTGLSETEKTSYQSVDPTTTSLFTTLASFANNKNFHAGIVLDLTSSEKAPVVLPEHSIDLDIAGNFDGISKVSDFDKGTYQLVMKDSMIKNGASNVANSLTANFTDSTLYMQFNNLFKGKISEATVQDIFKEASALNEDDAAKDTTDQLTSVLNGLKQFNLADANGKITIPESLINADYGFKVYQENETGDGYFLGFQINASAFNLGDYQITIKIDTDASKGFKDIAVEGLQYSGYTFGATIGFEDYTETTINAISTEAAAQYKDYSAALPIYKTISKLIDEKKFSASYSVTAGTKSGTSYLLSGNIDGDLSKADTSASAFADRDYGAYHFSVNASDTSASDKTSYAGKTGSFEAHFQDNSLYMDYGNGFKNYVPEASMAKAYDLADVKTGSNVSASISDLNDALDGLNDSEYFSSDFKTLLNEIQEGNLSGKLSSFVSIDKDNLDADKLIVEVNLPLVFSSKAELNSKVSAIYLEIDTDTDSLNAVKLNLGYDSNTVAIVLNLSDSFAEFALSDVSSYVSLEHPVNSFLNLPTQLDAFSVGLNASLTSGSSVYSLNGINSIKTGLASYKTGLSASDVRGDGQLILTEPDTTAHKIEYAYLPDEGNEFDGTTVEYNDKMHVKITNQSVVSLYDKVTSIDENNVLVKLISYLQDSADSLNIPAVIKNQDYSAIANDFITDFQIDDNKLVLTVNAALFTDDADDTSSITLSFAFDSTTDSITSASLKTADFEGFAADVALNLGDYDANYANNTDNTSRIHYGEAEKTSEVSSLLLYSSASAGKFIKFSDVSLLIGMGINTTNASYYNLTGTLSIGANVGNYISIDAFKLRIHIELQITDDGINIYLAAARSDKTDTSEEGFHVTEFFFNTAGSDVKVLQTVNAAGGATNLSSVFFKLSLAEFQKNILYYLVDYTLDLRTILGTGAGGKALGEIAMANIYKALTSSSSSSSGDSSAFSCSLNKDYSSYLVSAQNYTAKDYFGADIDLSQVLSFSGDTANDLDISLGHLLVRAYYSSEDNDEDGILTSLEIKGRSGEDLSEKQIVQIGSLASLNVAMHLNNNANVAASEQMSRYSEFMSYYNSDSSMQSLGDFAVTDVTFTSAFGIVTKATVNNNGSLLTYQAADGDASKAYFF